MVKTYDFKILVHRQPGQLRQQQQQLPMKSLVITLRVSWQFGLWFLGTWVNKTSQATKKPGDIALISSVERPTDAPLLVL